MQTRVLLIVGVLCCVFHDTTASENKEDVVSPHLIGGSPVDENGGIPIVLPLFISKSQKIINKTCEAAFVKSVMGYAYFVTAAECLEKNTDEVFVLGDTRNGRKEVLVVYNDYKTHPKYDKITKANNIAVFRVPDRFGGNAVNIIEDEGVVKPANLPAEVYSWRNVTREVDNEDRFELHSIKTKVINSIWCNILYPLSPIRSYHICASGWFVKGLEKRDLGAALLEKHPSLGGRFTLLGISTIVRPWSPYASFPMEFLRITPYKQWIMSFK